jgi:hypothetical protein
MACSIEMDDASGKAGGLSWERRHKFLSVFRGPETQRIDDGRSAYAQRRDLEFGRSC